MSATKMLRRLLNDERGIALVMALGTMIFLSVTVTTIVYYTSTNARSSTHGRAEQLAFGLAEAGINNAMAVLSLPSNNALKQNIMPSCSVAQSSWNENPYEGGRVEWCGTLYLEESAWRLTSVGIVTNPAGGSDVTRKLTAYVPIQPTVNQPLNNPAWNYIFATNTSTSTGCDMTLNENITMESALFVGGNLCMNNNSNIRVGPLIVKGRLSLSNNGTVGTSSQRIRVYVGGTSGTDGHRYCRQGSQHWHPDSSHSSHAVCGDQDNVFSVLANGSPGVDTVTPNLTKPNSDYAAWYRDGMPGPTQDCTTKSGPAPTWDNDSDRDLPNGSVATAFNLTPATSYTCRVGPAENPIGELSWNATTRVLTIRGTMYIDGSVYANNGQLNQYNGQATLYISGTFLLDNDTKLCGGVSGSSCDFSAWNPNTEMLVISANGSGGQVPTGYGVQLDNNSQFQGALYATYGLQLSNNSKTDGPMVGGTITLNQNFTGDDFGTISNVPAGMPDNPQVYAQPNPPTKFSG